jgi:hypothetical protein
MIFLRHDLLEALLNLSRYDPSIPPEYITEGKTIQVALLNFIIMRTMFCL